MNDWRERFRKHEADDQLEFWPDDPSPRYGVLEWMLLAIMVGIVISGILWVFGFVPGGSPV